MAARVSDEFQRHVSAWIVVQDIYPELMKDMINNTWPSPLVDKLLKGDLGQRLVKTFNTQQQRLVQSINIEGYRELDTELMYKIIRHLGLVDAPSSGWGKKPGSNDKTQGDDIERMRCNRNNVVHRPRLSLTENEYNEFFAESIDIAKRMDTKLGNPSNGFQKKIEDVKHLTVSPENGNKYLASNPEYQGSVVLNCMRKLNVYFGNDVKLRIENSKIENESTQCILYVRDPAMTDTSEIVRLLDEAKHTINEGKCEIKLLSIEEGSIIIHAFFNQGLKEMKYIYEELTLLFNYIFELNYADKNCGQQIYIVLAESEDTAIEDPSDDLEPFVLKPDCNPIQLLKMNVIVQNSSFQSVQTLHSAVHCFVDSVSNSISLCDSHRNGSSMDVVMIKNQKTKDQSDYSSFQSEQTLQSAVHGNVNSVDNSVDIGTVKRNGSSTDVVTITNHKEKDEQNMSSYVTYQKQDNTQNRIFSSKCGQNVHIQGNSVEWCSVNSGGRLYIETALPNAEVVLSRMSLQFSSHYGENVSVKNDFAEWKSTYSGGMCFAVLGKEPLKIKVCGSSHILIGYVEKDPNEIPIRDALNLLKRTSDIRVHKSTYKLSMRFSNDRKKLVLDSDNKKQERFSVENGRAWLGVYIQFGSASVVLESTNSSFMKCHGENIKLSNNDTEATLIHENPAAFCYIDRPMFGGEAINLQIKPVSDPVKGKSSCLPSRFYLKFGFHKNNLFCEQWEPVHTLDRNKCLGKLQLGVSTGGDFIYATETGENGSFKIPEFERESGIVCVLELFRVNAKLNDVVVCPQYDYALNKGPFPHVPNSMDGPMEITQKSLLESVSSTRILSITSEGDEVTENDEVFHETSAKESDKSHVQKLKFMSERETRTEHDYDKTSTKPKSTTNDIFTGDCDLVCNFSSTNSITVVGNQIERSKPANTSISENDNSNSSVKLLNSKDVTLFNPSSGLMNSMANERQVKVLNIPPSSTGKRSSESDEENNSKADFSGISISDIETDRKTDKSKLIFENRELKEQILTLKNENDSLKLENQRFTNEMRCLQEQLEQLSLGDNPNRPMSPNDSSSNSTNLCKTIQLNFVKFVDDLEIPDLCDHLFQKGLISAQDLEYLHQKVNLNKRDANRYMFGLIKRRSIPYESFIDSLKATKQDGLAHLLKVSVPQLTT